MQVIILATDEQTKLAPLTDTLPTPMVPVVDRPVLSSAIEIAARAGHKQIFVSLYNRGGQIAAFLGGGRRWGVDIKYLPQRQAWGTAGALRWAGTLLDETFLTLPGDEILDLDIEKALAFHMSKCGIATIVLHQKHAGCPTPVARLDGEMRLLGLESAEAEEMQLTGAFIFEPEVLRYITPRGSCDIVTDLIPALLKAGVAVFGYKMEGYWNPLMTMEDFQTAQQVYLYSAYYQGAPEQAKGGPTDRVRYPTIDARHIAPGVWVGRDHSIHPTVKLAPPVYIGNQCWIGRDVELAAATVVGSNVLIDDEATLRNSTVLNNTYIGRLVCIDNMVVTPETVSDPFSGATTRVVDPFLITRVGTIVGERNPLRRALSSTLALTLIILLSPLYLLTSLIVAITAGGKVIESSPRIGQRIGGAQGSLQTFQITRFRTRRLDGRHIIGGKFIERLELHRLPELFCVLKGEMTLVGVKPLTPEEAASLAEDWHQRRHEAPAGITGLWYLQTEADSDLDTVIVTDVYYTATRNWLNDLRLLLRTPGAWSRRLVKRGPDRFDDQGILVHVEHTRRM